MALLKQSSDKVLLQEGTVCSQLLLQDEITLCTGAPDALVFTGAAPSAEIDHFRSTGSTALSLTGIAPTITRFADPLVGSVSFTGLTPSAQVDAPRLTSVGTLTLTGFAPFKQVDAARVTSLGTLVFTGNTITQVLIGHTGTAIENKDASTQRINHVNACDYTGFRALPNELIPTDNGMMVLPEFWETNMSDHHQPRRSSFPKGTQRREPVGDERFVDEEYPDGVSADDL